MNMGTKIKRGIKITLLFNPIILIVVFASSVIIAYYEGRT